METAENILSLNLFAFDVTPLARPGAGASSAWQRVATAGRCTIAFTFLDYPTVLVHAVAADGYPVNHDARAPLRFGVGKSCTIHADASELAFISQRVRADGTAAQARCEGDQQQTGRPPPIRGCS
jgi:hypothetical protein